MSMNKRSFDSIQDPQYLYLRFPNLIRDRRILRVLTFFYALSITLGVVFRSSIPRTTGVIHATVHLVVFAILGTLISLSFDTPSVRLVLIFSGIALGVGSELYEHLVYQSPLEYGDILLDTLGVVIGSAEVLMKRLRALPANAL